jgi:hypothetical protein
MLILAAIWLGSMYGPQYLLFRVVEALLHTPLDPKEIEIGIFYFNKRLRCNELFPSFHLPRTVSFLTLKFYFKNYIIKIFWFACT